MSLTTYYLATPDSYCPSGIWKPDETGRNKCIPKDEMYQVPYDKIFGAIFAGIGVACSIVGLGYLLYWCHKQKQKNKIQPNSEEQNMIIE